MSLYVVWTDDDGGPGNGWALEADSYESASIEAARWLRSSAIHNVVEVDLGVVRRFRVTPKVVVEAVDE